jgi:hypothetical protein
MVLSPSDRITAASTTGVETDPTRSPVTGLDSVTYTFSRVSCGEIKEWITSWEEAAGSLMDVTSFSQASSKTVASRQVYFIRFIKT